MTRYGYAIKALPKKGGKPFGEEDDEQTTDTGEETLDDDLDPAALAEETPSDPADPTAPGAPPADPAAPDPTAPPEQPTEAPADGTQPPGNEPPADAPEPPSDDARQWAGDPYDEGDETDPANAFASYTGSNGEQAWLDQDADGTLTGWVRDGTGQVWRYTDPDAWAIDVDDAHMTQTHSKADEAASPPQAAPASDRGVQDSMFQ
ncbi:hypothetical protein ACFY1J_05175 [Streptomyces sp. NPDC001406]|uniref:hypothetical protein n=1 Tax=Streptomyces sp. NPDC001406 TaxID=3364572 RepID=UPI0036BC69A4